MPRQIQETALNSLRSNRYLLYSLVAVAIGGHVLLVVTGTLPIQTVAIPVVLMVGWAATAVLPLEYTRRGWTVLVVVSVAVTAALLHGTRALEAVVVPLVLAVAAATMSNLTVDRPEYRRILPENGHVGETRTVGIRFDVDSPHAGLIAEDLDEGLSSPNNRFEATIGASPVEYDLTYERRGPHRVGPLTVTVTDVLGLAARTFEYPEVGEVVVYPRIDPLSGVTRHELNLLAGGSPEREREEFHRLREYVTGDSLRDVHWKSSARQPDDELVVKEFVADDQFDDVTIVGEGPPERADLLAEAVASVAVHLLERGIQVGVTVADGSVPPSTGPDHRARLLELLARTDAGWVDDADQMDADVLVESGRHGAQVTAGDYETTYAKLAGRKPLDGNPGGRDGTGERADDAADEREVVA